VVSLEGALPKGAELVDDDLKADIQLCLKLGGGDFLPAFEDLERRVTGGRGIAGQVVNDVRQQILGLRGNLAGALADRAFAQRSPQEAIGWLEQAVGEDPAREDLARRLISAYLQTGQSGRAAELRRIHQIATEA
jgi:DNA-binding SARP family transcriptional activator